MASRIERVTFNRGLISPLALARNDLERPGLSAETYTNWMPRNLGSMMLRPGTSYIGNSATNAQARYIPFIYSATQTALLEFTTSSTLRVWESDTLVAGASVSTVITQGTMADLTMTNASQANPCEITVNTTHPYTTGDTVWISGVAGMTEINDREFTITDTGATTFTLDGEDATGHTAYSSGGFSSSWIDDDEAGATSAPTGFGGSTSMRMTGNGNAAARRTQKVTVAAPDQNVEHALAIVIGGANIPSNPQYISGAPVLLRVGVADGADDLISETALGTGYHYLKFTPTGGTFYIQFLNTEVHTAIVTSCSISTGTMSLPTFYNSAALLAKIRYDQSADVVYLACDGLPPYKVERRGAGSWSFVLYEPRDGPFRTINDTSTTMTASGLSGVISITSSNDFFRTDMEGSLIKLSSQGQTQTASIVAQNNFTSAIRVTGVGDTRVFTVDIDFGTGTGIGTVTLQRSFTSENGPWEDVPAQSYSSAAGAAADDKNFTYDDTKDNQVGWYRIGVKTGNYTSGTIAVTLSYANGSIDGVARIYVVTGTTACAAITLQTFGNTDATADWYIGEWSDRYGYPTTVALDEGRLGWAGRSKVWLSVSDAYESFDDAVIGDSGPIQRTIGSGAVDIVQWMLSARNLLVGGESNEYSIRASTDENILTPTNASQKKIGTRGAGNSIALNLDSTGLFVQQGGTRLIELAFNSEWQYGSSDLTLFNPAIGEPGITHIAIQRQPDTRIHCVRSDGTVAVLLHDPAENVSCWIELTAPGTDAAIEDVAVLPGADGSGEDSVYYSVKRTVNSSTVRFLEKWSLESECQGGTTNKQMDAHITGTVSSGTLTGLTHLEGETVAVWSNGKDVGTYAVSSGQITGVTEDGSAVAGLAYTAQWQSAKLGELTQRKNISDLSVILYNTHYQGLKYGPNFTDLDDLPQTKDGTVIAADTVHSDLDQPSFSFDGHWDSDARLCLQAASPRPCTLLAAVLDLEG
jgi:hypothetical protein